MLTLMVALARVAAGMPAECVGGRAFFARFIFAVSDDFAQNLQETHKSQPHKMCAKKSKPPPVKPHPATYYFPLN